MADGTQPVGDNNHRLPPVEIRQVFDYGALVVRVQGVCRLVEVKERRIAIDRAGYQDALPLSLAHALSVLPDDGIVAQGETLYELIDIRNRRGMGEFLRIDVVIIHGNVPRDGFGEQIAVLHHRPALSAPPPEAELLEVAAADGNPSLDGLVITQQELYQRRFSASAGADDGGYLSLRDIEAHVVQYFRGMRPFVLEGEVLYPDVAVLAGEGGNFALRCLFFLALADFTHALQGDLHVLPAIDELDELFHRRVQLSDDVLDGQHHTEREVPVDDGSRRHDGYHDVLYFVDEDTPGLLTLLQLHRLDVRAKQVRLHVFPFPATATLAILQLYLLHSVEHLHRLALVPCPLLEISIVQEAAFLQEEEDPRGIERAPEEEDQEDNEVVVEQHRSEDDEAERREHHRQRLRRQKPFHPVVVLYALYQVADELRIEERHRQFHQLNQEIREQRDVYPRRNMQQYPPPDEVHRRAARHQHQLPQKYQVNQVQVLPLDSFVHDGLRQEGEYQLQDAPERQSQQQLHEISLVGLHITPEEVERPLHPPLLVALLIKSRRRLERHQDAFLFAPCPRAYPSVAHRVFVQLEEILARVGDAEDVFAVAPRLDVVEDHEMFLVPMQDAGEGALLDDFLQRDASADGPEAQIFRRVADAEHRDTFARNEAQSLHRLRRIFFAVILGYHAEAGCAALHGVGLLDERE